MMYETACTGCGATTDDGALYPGTGGRVECWTLYQTGTCETTEA